MVAQTKTGKKCGNGYIAKTKNCNPVAQKNERASINAIHARYKNATNMSAKELEVWAANPASHRASLDRSPIERNLRLLRKNVSQWTDEDAKDARRTINFIQRMKGAKEGKPINKSIPYSRREISLRNWAYNSYKASGRADSSNEVQLSVEPSMDSVAFERRILLTLDPNLNLETSSVSEIKNDFRACVEFLVEDWGSRDRLSNASNLDSDIADIEANNGNKDLADYITEAALNAVAPAVTTWLTQIEEFIGNGKSLSDVRDSLPQLYNQLDENKFAETIRKNTTLAHLAGGNEVLEEVVSSV